MKAVFIDRDGVLTNNSIHYYVHKPADVSLLPGVLQGLRALQQAGYLLFVITNQGGVAKGLYSEADVDAVHAHMLKLFADAGVHISHISFCPHHPAVTNCLCRKPGSLMLERLLATYHIKPHESWMIGDSDTDTRAGERAGLRCILTESNADFGEAANVVLQIIDENRTHVR